MFGEHELILVQMGLYCSLFIKIMVFLLSFTFGGYELIIVQMGISFIFTQIVDLNVCRNNPELFLIVLN